MNVLVIGSGGREHALAWKLKQSPDVETVYCAPGNANIDAIEAVPLTDFDDLAAFATAHQVGMTVVGPEAPLCAGIVDHFQAKGLAVFGPSKEAARLEGSKAYAKSFMNRHGIPTADHQTCTTMDAALAAIERLGIPVVIKADGLAAGKGVIVAATRAEARDAVARCFDGEFGDAGTTVLVEEFLTGEEASILALTDGTTIVPLVSSQDHKAVGEGDTGPNTGGMGAYSPAPVVTPALWETIDRDVLQRFVKGCQDDGLDYHGVIYAGVMVTPAGPKVLEFNVRFGDPEIQAVLMRLDSDLLDALSATVNGRLSETELHWADEPAACVVMASGGYPGAYRKGDAITGLDRAAETGAVVFHAGTARDEGQVVSNGGRVLGVTARGKDLQAALDQAYAAVDCIHWADAFHRRDIGHRALGRDT